ncbi:MAG: hypothetical protein ACRDTF_19640 [Pseudonocardiaceae bacterium]
MTGEIAGCALSPLRSCVEGILALLRDNGLARAEELLDDANHGQPSGP